MYTLGNFLLRFGPHTTLYGLCDLSNSVTRDSCLKLVKPTYSITKYFFTSMVIDIWNCLNDDIVKSPSICKV